METAAASAVAEDYAGPYRVRLEVFEGPLDLLLHLIKKHEVEIADIPIAAITEQYVAYLELLHELELDVAGEFLVMAATLTLIKSRLLLPREEEEEEEGDPRAELVEQLLEYQRFREAAMALDERPLLQRDVFARAPSPPASGPAAEPPPLRGDVFALLEAFRTVLARAAPEPVHAVEAEGVSLRQRARVLLDAFTDTRRVAFADLFPSDASREVLVVTFLALLELIRLGAVRAEQEARCGPIAIELAIEDVSTVSVDGVGEYEGAADAGH